VLAKPEQGGASLQSPFDPGAGYGHKGGGYHVHIVETCGNKSSEIITHFEVVPANTADCTLVKPVLARLEELERKPQVLFADSGYATTETVRASAAAGTTLYAPISAGRLPDDYIGRDSFKFDAATGEVLECPAGHAPVRHGMRATANSPAGEKSPHAHFASQTCKACPLLGRCATRPGNNSESGTFQIEILSKLVERDQALERQKDPAWWKAYAIRSGVEATMSEVKSAHGMAHLRVRKRPRVILAVACKLIACNAKRWIRASAAARRSGRPGDSYVTALVVALMALVLERFIHMRHSAYQHAR